MPAHISPSPALLVISAMVTPALLILGTGSLVATSLQRLSRAVDRARWLALLSKEDMARLGWTRETTAPWLRRYGKRAVIAERAVRSFFFAVALLVLTCLMIALDHFLGNTIGWLPISCTVLGMVFMLFGAYCMVLECRLASIQVHDEIQTLTGEKLSG